MTTIITKAGNKYEYPEGYKIQTCGGKVEIITPDNSEKVAVLYESSIESINYYNTKYMYLRISGGL